ncbi:probable WRKY transcription factor 21 [Tanacetum coccineum]
MKVPVVCNTLADIPRNEYSWRKYGHEPIKGKSMSKWLLYWSNDWCFDRPRIESGFVRVTAVEQFLVLFYPLRFPHACDLAFVHSDDLALKCILYLVYLCSSNLLCKVQYRWFIMWQDITLKSAQMLRFILLNRLTQLNAAFASKWYHIFLLM